MTHPRASASPRAAEPSTAVAPDQVRDALAHLYDPGHLQTHPLAAFGGGRALRSALLDAVEAFKPPREGRPGQKALRRHQLPKRRHKDGLAPGPSRRSW